MASLAASFSVSNVRKRAGLAPTGNVPRLKLETRAAGWEIDAKFG